jgi:hypothetical protein
MSRLEAELAMAREHTCLMKTRKRALKKEVRHKEHSLRELERETLRRMDPNPHRQSCRHDLLQYEQQLKEIELKDYGTSHRMRQDELVEQATSPRLPRMRHDE